MVVSITAFRDVAAGETLLNSVSGIDATADAITNLYTVPSEQTVVVTRVVLRVEAIDTLTVDPVGGVGIAAGEADIFAPLTITDLTAVGDTWTFAAEDKAIDASAAEIIKLGLDTLATATTLTLAAEIFGYFVGTLPIGQAGGNVGSWESFTPTGSWTTNVTYSGMHRTVGDEVFARYKLEFAGAPGGATFLTLDPPTGFTPDDSKFMDTDEPVVSAKVSMLDTGVALRAGVVLWDRINTVFPVRFPTSERISGGGTDDVSTSKPHAWGNGDWLYCEISFPVT